MWGEISPTENLPIISIAKYSNPCLVKCDIMVVYLVPSSCCLACSTVGSHHLTVSHMVPWVAQTGVLLRWARSESAAPAVPPLQHLWVGWHLPGWKQLHRQNRFGWIQLDRQNSWYSSRYSSILDGMLQDLQFTLEKVKLCVRMYFWRDFREKGHSYICNYSIYKNVKMAHSVYIYFILL